MRLELNLNNIATRVLMLLISSAACALLVFITISNFIEGMVTDNRVAITSDGLAASLEYFPNSAAIHARLADNELNESARDLDRIVFHAQQAVNLSPCNYKHRVLLASAKESIGDRAAAERELESAARLAPNNGGIRWRLANVRVRAGRLDRSLDEFRRATSADASLLPATLDLIWRASNGRVDALEAATSDEPRARLKLASFLVKQSRVDEAATVIAGLDPAMLRSFEESALLVNSLISAGHLEQARKLWSSLVANGADQQLIHNGGFEDDIIKGFAQFDWNLSRSRYATVKVVSGTSRAGKRALRIKFAGLDTTTLNNEVRQLVFLRPGARYRLVCYAKAEDLKTPEGPRVIVTEGKSKVMIASSEPISSEPGDWQRVAVEFVAPQGEAGNLIPINILIHRKPKYSYDEPTSGTIWLDDFSLEEIK